MSRRRPWATTDPDSACAADLVPVLLLLLCLFCLSTLPGKCVALRLRALHLRGGAQSRDQDVDSSTSDTLPLDRNTTMHVGEAVSRPPGMPDYMTVPYPRLSPLADLRKGMRQEVERLERYEDRRRPNRIKAPLRGSRELLSPGFVDRREVRPGNGQQNVIHMASELAAAEQGAAESEAGDGLVAETCGLGPFADSEEKEWWTKMMEKEDKWEAENGEEQETYVRHFLDWALARVVYDGEIAEIAELVRLGASVNRCLPEDDDRMQPNTLGVRLAVATQRLPCS